MMHYAPAKRKCLLHYEPCYFAPMDQVEVGKRLARARKAAGFDSAKAAAEALNIPIATYIQHENGTRGFRAPTAERYAKRFKTTPEWILYAKGGEAGSEPTEDDLAEMVRTALDAGVTVQTKLVDLPRIVAPVLREQLERYRADRGVIDFWGEKAARDKGARSPAATRPVGSARSRTP